MEVFVSTAVNTWQSHPPGISSFSIGILSSFRKVCQVQAKVGCRGYLMKSFSDDLTSFGFSFYTTRTHGDQYELELLPLLPWMILLILLLNY